ncbi:MAG: outer membrane lipoprotein-sorting protein [Candidatus Electrothrix sp. AW1]|nr:outer membrane lipoprotein-sorting protein [Candidatus Electrothrix sp. AX1]MCI5181742.1 outer membrane lipoprotein-sorting protein [Candidatus Electrothrix gigas]
MKKTIINAIITACSLFALLTTPVMAENLNVEEIANKANLAAYYAGNDGKATVNMTITDSQGRERTREFIILRKDIQDGGKQLFYVYFKKPSDVSKMVFMVHKNVTSDDDRWMYLPALDLVKRIAASDKRTSFVGSNFMYEDVSGRNLSEDTRELVGSNNTHYLIKNTPKKPDDVEFSSYTVQIDKKTFLPVKAVYLDKNGKEYRIVEATKVEDIDGIPTVIESKVTDLAARSHTVSKFSKVKYNIGLKENIFTERYLRRPPREARR